MMKAAAAAAAGAAVGREVAAAAAGAAHGAAAAGVGAPGAAAAVAAPMEPCSATVAAARARKKEAAAACEALHRTAAVCLRPLVRAAPGLFEELRSAVMLQLLLLHCGPAISSCSWPILQALVAPEEWFGDDTMSAVLRDSYTPIAKDSVQAAAAVAGWPLAGPRAHGGGSNGGRGGSGGANGGSCEGPDDSSGSGGNDGRGGAGRSGGGGRGGSGSGGSSIVEADGTAAEDDEGPGSRYWWIMSLLQHDLNVACMPRWMLDLLEQPTPAREERAAYFFFFMSAQPPPADGDVEPGPVLATDSAPRAQARGSEPGSAAPEQCGVPMEAEAEVARESCTLKDISFRVWHQAVDDRHVQAGLLMEGPEVDLADMPPHLERLELRGVLHLVNSAAPDHAAGGVPSTAVGGGAGCGGAAGGGARGGLALLRACTINSSYLRSQSTRAGRSEHLDV
ncbi:hypothetical protein TSOC_005331 [Tetrabaena socialis]|uniref:Uncharacterized protein n=1 Tax=Tetrabaena socialis TaxID=47790 RepID=A0A2J8A6I8_9CHLO|nr:hypothetical protein TSOC_005331 [Tetrabaena socialis]|eukprot:PNH08139.1 hypothetical protein TSOC_005331 [Tetrabaena socialis]